MELSSQVDTKRAIALNQNEAHPVANLFIHGSQYELQSDADDQLVIFIPFKEKVRIQGIRFVAPANDNRPVRVKLFINNANLDFADCEQRQGEFHASLTASNVMEDSKPLALRVAKFTSVDSVTVFVESSVGGDISALSKIDFFGQVMMGTNMNELKKVG
eukprot:CAMPEP_0204845908 /NCGR_PEP_ID=MMETSP1347-20130617/1570_1 /ASSEMBLY_ACC=CAM_ASM_000690 /TAXON_ID=215587 /ORGANISM="Aplanochytrium stocchinoi, Strain GSBS06" /LENGTH=159 /DNA_ID=CAMNT_0051986219 /DNA_START=107 /DNA_END=586 /DNA_ORIENTATION=-